MDIATDIRIGTGRGTAAGNPSGRVSSSAGGVGAGASETPNFKGEVAKYLSPVFRFDDVARVLLFQYRDNETGQVERQYPAREVVERYRENNQRGDQRGQIVNFGGDETSGTGDEPPVNVLNPNAGKESSDTAPVIATGNGGRGSDTGATTTVRTGTTGGDRPAPATAPAGGSEAAGRKLIAVFACAERARSDGRKARRLPGLLRCGPWRRGETFRPKPPIRRR